MFLFIPNLSILSFTFRGKNDISFEGKNSNSASISSNIFPDSSNLFQLVFHRIRSSSLFLEYNSHILPNLSKANLPIPFSPDLILPLGDTYSFFLLSVPIVIQ